MDPAVVGGHASVYAVEAQKPTAVTGAVRVSTPSQGWLRRATVDDVWLQVAPHSEDTRPLTVAVAVHELSGGPVVEIVTAAQYPVDQDPVTRTDVVTSEVEAATGAVAVEVGDGLGDVTVAVGVAGRAEPVPVGAVAPGPGCTARVQLEAHEPEGVRPVIAVKCASICAWESRPP
jgi:hypothetical protein